VVRVKLGVPKSEEKQQAFQATKALFSSTNNIPTYLLRKC
jgi:hypothetical protein